MYRATRSAAFWTLVLVGLLTLSPQFPLSLYGPALGYTPHAPIFIDGNGAFTPANGVTSGNGTPSDPYLIEGWEINASAGTGIRIWNSDVHFVIRGVYVHSGSPSDGIYLANVRNGRIENSSLANNGNGIHLAAWNVTVDNNVFTSNGVKISGNSVEDYRSHTIPPTNTVNGLPLHYYKDCNGLDVNGGLIGQLIVANCTDVTVRNVQVVDASVGILMAFVNRGRIASANLLSNFDSGMLLTRSTNLTVELSEVQGSTAGIRCSWSSGLVLRENHLLNNNAYEVSVSRSSNVSVDRNIVQDSRATNQGDGIYLEWSSGANITRNSISGHLNAMIIWASDSVEIADNVIENNAPGVFLGFAAGARVFHNVFSNNTFWQGADNRGPENAWDDGYPSGGNWWSDYTGMDNCSGPLQNICPVPDGIGDTPYVLDADSQDNYPLMNPPDLLPPSAPVLTDATLTGPAAADLTLQWNASPDEGTANGTVAYRVLRATDWTGPYAEVASLPANGSPSYQYTCLGCGHSLVDTASYFFQVQAVDAANNTADSNLGAKYAKAMAGRTLLTVPVAVSDVSLATVLQTLGTDLTAAWTYDASDAMDPWKSYSTIKGGGDLAVLPFGTAFWVDTAAAGVYTVAGLVDLSPMVSLSPGWNLGAYATPRGETAAESMAGLPDVVKVQTYEIPAPYHVRAVPSGEMLVWGEGYWLYTTAGGTWNQG